MWNEAKHANADIAAEVTLEVNPSALVPVSDRRTAVIIYFLKKNKLSEEAMCNFIQLSLSLLIPVVFNVRKIAQWHEYHQWHNLFWIF